MNKREVEVVILLVLCAFCIWFGTNTFFTFRKEIDRIDRRVEECYVQGKENSEYLERKARQYESLFEAYTKGVQGDW